jgi:hypothetical protein
MLMAPKNMFITGVGTTEIRISLEHSDDSILHLVGLCPLSNILKIILVTGSVFILRKKIWRH